MEQRTDWVERFVAALAATPLTHECVFLNPHYLDDPKRGVEKEVCDLLFVLDRDAVIVSLKCQQDPASRDEMKEVGWAKKKTIEGVRQLQGAVRTLATKDVWCRHARLGKYEFSGGTLKIHHAIVLTEVVKAEVELPREAVLSIDLTPVTYLSVYDWCNLLTELRTLPELMSYLDARRNLPPHVLTRFGCERDLFSFYLLNEESFAGCAGPEDARIAVAAREARLNEIVSVRRAARESGGFIEYLCDCLATRAPDFAADLTETELRYYDDPTNRRNYLRLQKAFCDLRLFDREALGAQFRSLIETMKLKSDPTNVAGGIGWVDAKPHFLYLFICTRGFSRPEVIRVSLNLLRATLTHHRKDAGIVVADRDGASFECALLERFTPTARDHQLASEWVVGTALEKTQTTIRPLVAGAFNDVTLLVPPTDGQN